MRRVALVLALHVAALAPVYAQPADWGVRRDPFDRTLIARYKAILVRQPHDPLALSALVSLYKRHRTIDLLVREYEEAHESGETASTAVVLARLARNAHDNKRAVELYARAVELDRTDGRSWTALGELRAIVGDKAGSREAFAQASSHAKTAAQKEAALRALIGATRDVGDREAMEAAFIALLERRPRDGKLWAERADAAVEQAAYDAAIAHYAKAESLLRRDPERRLLVIAARALAFDRADKPAEAINEYARAQDASPRGYYLRRELTFKIIDVFRRHDTLDSALDYLAGVWPEAKRGGFEWGTIAGLHEELRQTDAMLAALHQAVKKDPRDTTLQWKLIRQYDARKEETIALSLLETAAKASPRDVSLNVELAQRLWSAGYYDVDEEDPVVYPDRAAWAASRENAPLNAVRRRALAIMRALSAALPRDAEAHRTIAEVFARWGRIDLAVGEARKLAALEPSDDNHQMLGDALFAAGRKSEAIEVWKKLATSAKPAALQRLGEVYLDHEMWDEAVSAFTSAMFGDDKNPMLWRGRAIALAGLGRHSEARVDAAHAVKLLGVVPYETGHEVRFRLVHLVREEAIQDAFGDDTVEPDSWLQTWDKAFFVTKPADLQAGYLLAEYYRRRPDEQLARVLERLHELLPADLGVVRELIRTYRGLAEYDKAAELASWLAGADPANAADMTPIIAAINDERVRTAAKADEAQHDAEYFQGTCDECRYVVGDGSSAKHALQLGVRLGVGDDLRETAGSQTAGLRLRVPLQGGLAATARLDYVRRTTASETLHGVAAGAGIAYPVAGLSSATLVAGTGLRGELRLGDAMTYDRVGLAADATLELMPRTAPVTLGMRFEQSLSERARHSTLLLEATVELR
jgi:tetratricopeptide (TPR) repeat protein